MCFVETSQEITSFTVESCVVYGPDESVWHLLIPRVFQLKKKEREEGEERKNGGS